MLIIEPRRLWIPDGSDRRRGIPSDLQLRQGRALSRYGDGGWGEVVRRSKYGDHGFPQELVQAAANAVRRWGPDPAPTWLTCVPSRADPDLVEDLARRLAAALDVPFVSTVVRTRGGRPQKEMENSAQQLRNVRCAFQVVGPVMPGAVLLVDDIVDSRWTLTAVGVGLREAGSGPVHPFVLAKAVSS